MSERPWAVTEHGVFADRRSDGLGFSLLQTTTGGRDYAERLLSLVQVEHKYPLFLRERVVVYQPWTCPTPPAASGGSGA